MNSNRKTAIIIGLLFLIAMVTFFLGDGFIESILDDSDYLINASANFTQVIIGVLIAFIDGIAIVGIAVLLFPILKKYNEPTKQFLTLSHRGSKNCHLQTYFSNNLSSLSL